MILFGPVPILGTFSVTLLIGSLVVIAFIFYNKKNSLPAAVKKEEDQSLARPEVSEQNQKPVTSALSSEAAAAAAGDAAVISPTKPLATTRTSPAYELAKASKAANNVESCNGGACACKDDADAAAASDDEVRRVVILYGTTTGNSKEFSQILKRVLEDKKFQVETADMAGIEPEDKLVQEAERGRNSVLVVIVSTYTEGAPPESAAWFYKWLEEASKDFRVQHSMLKGLKYAVFGLGNSLYSGHYNVIGKQVDKFLFQLSATRFHSLGLGDENVAGSKHGNMEADFDHWSKLLVQRIQKWNSARGSNPDKQQNCCKDNKTSDFEEDEEEENDSMEEESSAADEDSDEDAAGDDDGLVDLEDLGSVMKKAKGSKAESQQPKEMITPLLRKSLTKQGYKLIGSHSGVKICRWTKAMLRGRGGCYKHTFYGIESHRCMETTPSLACANKCVFCWRHHSNPVGTEWKWQMDPPQMILDGALENHYKMIRQMKGVPGVLPEKLEEGLAVQHCALSLVGEPIMYPEINEFVRLLHAKGISSFLVTNAQFPDAIRDMEPCTQLYVSIDASTKEALKAIDRPLHKDFWERFIASLKQLALKGQRTVYRLTLVKGWNAEEMQNYANLVALGNPDFIEIKGVTYCGTSKASKLTMENVPWHEEVVHFVSQLADRLPDYKISCEHEHSNCVLLTHKRFKVEGRWHTWIDYPKFHQLATRFKESGGTHTFKATDYMEETPQWAVFGSQERGFDPDQTRFHRKSKKADKDS